MEKPKNKKPGRRQTISEENPANLKQKSSPMPIKLKIVRSGTSSDYSVNLGIQEKLESTKMKNLQVIVKKLSDSDIGRLSGSKQSQSDKKIAKKFRNENSESDTTIASPIKQRRSRSKSREKKPKKKSSEPKEKSYADYAINPPTALEKVKKSRRLTITTDVSEPKQKRPRSDNPVSREKPSRLAIVIPPRPLNVKKTYKKPTCSVAPKKPAVQKPIEPEPFSLDSIMLKMDKAPRIPKIKKKKPEDENGEGLIPEYQEGSVPVVETPNVSVDVMAKFGTDFVGGRFLDTTRPLELMKRTITNGETDGEQRQGFLNREALEKQEQIEIEETPCESKFDRRRRHSNSSESDDDRLVIDEDKKSESDDEEIVDEPEISGEVAEEILAEEVHVKVEPSSEPIVHPGDSITLPNIVEIPNDFVKVQPKLSPPVIQLNGYFDNCQENSIGNFKIPKKTKEEISVDGVEEELKLDRDQLDLLDMDIEESALDEELNENMETTDPVVEKPDQVKDEDHGDDDGSLSLFGSDSLGLASDRDEDFNEEPAITKDPRLMRTVQKSVNAEPADRSNIAPTPKIRLVNGNCGSAEKSNVILTSVVKNSVVNRAPSGKQQLAVNNPAIQSISNNPGFPGIVGNIQQSPQITRIVKNQANSREINVNQQMAVHHPGMHQIPNNPGFSGGIPRVVENPVIPQNPLIRNNLEFSEMARNIQQSSNEIPRPRVRERVEKSEDVSMNGGQSLFGPIKKIPGAQKPVKDAFAINSSDEDDFGLFDEICKNLLALKTCPDEGCLMSHDLPAPQTVLDTIKRLGNQKVEELYEDFILKYEDLFVSFFQTFALQFGTRKLIQRLHKMILDCESRNMLSYWRHVVEGAEKAGYNRYTALNFLLKYRTRHSFEASDVILDLIVNSPLETVICLLPVIVELAQLQGYLIKMPIINRLMYIAGKYRVVDLMMFLMKYMPTLPEIPSPEYLQTFKASLVVTLKEFPQVFGEFMSNFQ